MKKTQCNHTLIGIGFGNVVAASKVVAIVSPGSSPMRKLREEARSTGRLVDATEGRRTRSIIITESGHVILSALQGETLAAKFSHIGSESEAKKD